MKIWTATASIIALIGIVIFAAVGVSFIKPGLFSRPDARLGQITAAPAQVPNLKPSDSFMKSAIYSMKYSKTSGLAVNDLVEVLGDGSWEEYRSPSWIYRVAEVDKLTKKTSETAVLFATDLATGNTILRRVNIGGVELDQDGIEGKVQEWVSIDEAIKDSLTSDGYSSHTDNWELSTTTAGGIQVQANTPDGKVIVSGLDVNSGMHGGLLVGDKIASITGSPIYSGRNFQNMMDKANGADATAVQISVGRGAWPLGYNERSLIVPLGKTSGSPTISYGDRVEFPTISFEGAADGSARGLVAKLLNASNDSVITLYSPSTCRDECYVRILDEMASKANDGTLHRFLSFGAEPISGSHAARALIAIADLEFSQNKWALVRGAPNVDYVGSYGKAPHVKFQRLDDGTVALVGEEDYMGQGSEVKIWSLYVPVGQNYLKALSLTSGYDDSGRCGSGDTNCHRSSDNFSSTISLTKGGTEFSVSQTITHVTGQKRAIEKRGWSIDQSGNVTSAAGSP